MDPNWIVALGTMILAIVAWCQLKKLNKTLKTNSLMAVLELESEMSRKKGKYEKSISLFKNLEYAQCQNKEKDDYSGYLRSAKDDIETSLENYLYSLNRLCYCVINGYISNKDWKSEYHELISSIIKNHKNYFDTNSKYPNIMAIYSKWQKE